MEKEKKWSARKHKLSWFDFFLEIHPEAESKFQRVVFDEKSSYYLPKGLFKSELYKKDILGDVVIPVSSLMDKPMDLIYQPEVFRFFQEANSSLKFSQQFDSIVWTQDADIKFPLKKSQDYFPEYCTGQ